jgi:hypothetical protein
MTLTIYEAQLFQGKYYIRHGRVYFGESAKVMKLAFNLTSNIWVKVIK